MTFDTNLFNLDDFVNFAAVSPDYYREIDLRDRERIIEKVTRYSQMFTLKGGTSTIPNWRLKQLIMMLGFGAFAPKDGKLYFLRGTLGGEPTPAYVPKNFVFSNPYIPWSAELEIGEECVLVKNDSGFQGILPILKRHTHLQSHVDLSFYLTTVMSRLTAFGVAGRDAEAEAINNVLEDIERGKLRALTDQNILNQIHTQPYAGDARFITSLIEMMQYSKASEATDLGLQANWNAKRESLTASETLLNENVIHTFADNMFDCWTEWINEVNEKYGEYLDEGLFELEWGSSWQENEVEKEATVTKETAEAELVEAQVEQAEQQAEQPNEEQPEETQNEEPKEGEENGETD